MENNTLFNNGFEPLTEYDVTPSYEDATQIIKKLYQIANTSLMYNDLSLTLEAIKEIIEFKGYKESKKIIILDPEERIDMNNLGQSVEDDL